MGYEGHLNEVLNHLIERSGHLNEVPGGLIGRLGHLNELHRHPILVLGHLHEIRRSFDAFSGFSNPLAIVPPSELGKADRAQHQMIREPLRITPLFQQLYSAARVLPPAKQQEVLRFVQSLQPQSAVAQKSLRLSFAEKLLPDLQRIHLDRDESPSPVYADSLIRTMQEMRGHASREKATRPKRSVHANRDGTA